MNVRREIEFVSRKSVCYNCDLMLLSRCKDLAMAESLEEIKKILGTKILLLANAICVLGPAEKCNSMCVKTKCTRANVH